MKYQLGKKPSQILQIVGMKNLWEVKMRPNSLFTENLKIFGAINLPESAGCLILSTIFRYLYHEKLEIKR